MEKITSQKLLIEKLEDKYKLEKNLTYTFPPRLINYYITKKGCDEIVVARNIVKKLIEKGLIDYNLDYVPYMTKLKKENNKHNKNHE